MTHSRHGKIARLPRLVRRQINERLQNGEPGKQIVAWLNGLPEVQTLTQAEFEGHPIREQNLSEWRKGGYRDWLKHQEAMNLARELSADADELNQVTGEPLSDKVAPLLAAKYMVILKTLAAADGEDPEDWHLLRELCGDFVELRRGDHSAQHLKLERERFEEFKRSKIEAGLDALCDEIKANPVARDQWSKFREAVIGSRTEEARDPSKSD